MLGTAALIGLMLGGSALSAGANVASTAITNKKNIDLMREQNAFNSAEAQKARLFNAEEAQKQRDYETMMSNTAYQRSVSDMESAGINPIMAASAGGAGTPVGQAASGEAAHSGATARLQPPEFADIITNSVLKAVFVSNMLPHPVKKMGFV